MLAEYAQNVGAMVDREALDTLIQNGKNQNPSVAIVIPVEGWESPELAEQQAMPQSERLREIVSWATGDTVVPIGYVTLGPDAGQSWFRALYMDESHRRQRLGFGNTGEDYRNSLHRMLEQAENDDRFRFFLSLLHDANHERNLAFRIARYFTVLEAMAARLKGNGVGSRDAIRSLLGIEKGKTGECVILERKYRYDVILAAGKLRDHLYHGSSLDSSQAKPHERDSFELLDKHPEVIARDLQSRVELEIQKWSNSASKGQ